MGNPYYDLISFKRMVEPHIKNWKSVILLRLGVIKSLTIRMRDGKKYHLSYSGGKIRFENYTFHVDNKRQYGNTLHLIIENLITEQYKMIPVKGRVVVDIGAGVADTAIYFAKSGAKRVYAYEPYPYTFNLARKNLKVNNLGRKIELINEAVSNKSGRITLAQAPDSYHYPDLKASKSGKSIRITTLNDIVKKLRIKDGALKIDAERYERQVILGADRKTLRSFSHIIAEYNQGHSKISKKLLGAGFEVKVYPSEDIYFEKMPDAEKDGLLYAERR
jgi:FkbM family methyltransferase